MQAGQREVLVRIAKAIGRWVIVRYLEYGRTKLVHYMEGRVDVFEGRLRKARSEARKVWLEGRIGRWKHAIEWLRTEGKELARKTVAELAGELEGERCALVAEAESFGRDQANKLRRAARRAERKARRKVRRSR